MAQQRAGLWARSGQVRRAISSALLISSVSVMAWRRRWVGIVIV
ncbi:hypothetical protein I552_6745 [Mycobacterium xenopi 3993]|nr:hypothetical protein I552_6745 [Mycobacterium xenopi 3993]